MYLYVFDLPSDEFFKKASQIETNCPDGEWRYFYFLSKTSVHALYQSEKKIDGFATLLQHNDFFHYFLGLFGPSVSENIKVESHTKFLDFCVSLNKHLEDKNKILDLSNKNFWIWTKDTQGIHVPKKLKGYLDLEA